LRIKIVVAGGLALTAIAVFGVLLHSPAMVIATNGMPTTSVLTAAKENVGACQTGETLPAGTTAIRLSLEATTGPLVDVEVLEGSRIVTRGTEGTGWFGSAVTVPVPPLRRTLEHAKLCFQMRLLTGYVALSGGPSNRASAATSDGKALPGRIRVSYLRSSGRSWWSLTGAVIQNMALGRAASGTWIVFPIAALAAAAIALGSWVLIRELR
jgi:hypothetical protein